MKRFATAALVLAGLALIAPVMAQQGGGRGFFGRLNLAQLPAPLQDRLHLTEDQKSHLQQIRDSSREKLRDARQNSSGDQQADRQKMQEIFQKAEADSEALLTPDQKTEWDRMKEHHRNYQGLGPRSSVALLGVEGLSEDQKSQLKSLATDTGGKLRDIRQNSSGDQQGAREKARALMTETEASIRKILHDDQVKQFDATLAAIPERRPQNQ
jgi:predicted  nucleic acid-binding Zn-ribbon protein